MGILNSIKALGKPRGFTPKPYIPRGGRSQPGQYLMVSDELQLAQKAIPYNQMVDDFINDTGLYGQIYTDHQLESAYRTSTYLFAALRRFASLTSEVELVGEQRKGDSWTRLPETHALNRIFINAGRQFMFDLAIYYGLFGKELIYKRKTRQAVYERNRGKQPGGFLKGYVSGVHLIPNLKWTIYEDSYHDEIQGFSLNEPDENVGGAVRMLEPWEVIYIHDFDARDPNDGVSMTSLAINDAVTNAAIARWMSHYFMSGAMPLLLVNTMDSPTLMTDTDLAQYKSQVERAWQGIWGKFSLRAMFTDRKLEVQQAGIKAEEVQAPEQDRTALNHIASVFQIAPDLIVPPEGGSDNARHKFLLLDAYHSAVLPYARKVADSFSDALELAEGGYRLVVAEERIKALEVERADKADTEIAIFNAGLTKYGEAQERLDSEQVSDLAEMIMTGGKLRSVGRIKLDDRLASGDVFQYIQNGWLDGSLKRSQYMMLAYGVTLPEGEHDGYIWEIDPRQIEDVEAKRLTNAQIRQQLASGGAQATPPPDQPNPPQLPPSTGGQPPSTGGGDAPAPKPDKPEKPDQPTVAADENSGNPLENADAPAIHYAHEQPVQQVEQLDTPEPVPVQEMSVPEVAELPTAAMPVVPLQEGVGLDVITLDQPMISAPTLLPPMETSVPHPAYLCLMLPNDSLVLTARQALAELIGEDGAKWVPPETYHVTVLYCPDASDADLAKARSLLPAQCPALDLRIEALDAFDTAEGTCAVLKVEPDNALMAFQSQVRAAFEAYQLPISPYSTAEGYTPHITLGYLPREAVLPEYACSFVVEPASAMIGRDDYQPIYELENIRLYAARMLSEADLEPLPVSSAWDDLPPDAAHTLNAEPEDQQAVLEAWRQRIDAERDTMRGALAVWKQTGAFPEGLGHWLVGCTNAAREAGYDVVKVLQAAKQAVDTGQFDADAPDDDNPILSLLAQQKGGQMSAEKELTAWKKQALQQGGAKSAAKFETLKLPLEIETAVRTKLATAASKAEITDVFEQARALLKAMTDVQDLDETNLTEWAERISSDPQLYNLLNTD